MGRESERLKTTDVDESDKEIFQINTLYNVHQIKSNWTKTIMVKDKNIVIKLNPSSNLNIIP